MGLAEDFLNDSSSDGVADRFLADVPPPKPKGAIGYGIGQVKAGVLGDLPVMAGKALQYISPDNSNGAALGAKLRTYGEEQQAANPVDESQGGITKFVAGGARAVSAMAPAAVGGIAAHLLAPEATIPADLAIGAGMGGMFGGSQGQDTLEKGRASGLSEDQAKSAARKTAAIQGIGMAGVSALTGGLTGPLARAAFGTGVKTAEQAVAQAAAPSALKPFLQDTAVSTAGNVASMTAANAATAGVEQNAGIQGGPTPGEAAAQSVKDALAFSLVHAPLGGIHTAMAVHGAKVARDQLTNANTDPAIRTQHADQIFNNIYAVDPDAANNFRENAEVAIKNQEPLVLDENVVKPNNGVVPEEAPLQLTNNPDPWISFPDGTVGKKSDVDTYIKGLPEDQQVAARAKLLGLGSQPADQNQTKPLALENNPTQTPMISFPDGTVGTRSDADKYINSLPENQRLAARAKLLGMGEQQTDAGIPTSTVDPRLGITQEAAEARIGNQIKATTPEPMESATADLPGGADLHAELGVQSGLDQIAREAAAQKAVAPLTAAADLAHATGAVEESARVAQAEEAPLTSAADQSTSGDKNALQEQGAGSLLQRQPEAVGETGSERGRVEQVEQGTEAATPREATTEAGNPPAEEVKPTLDQRLIPVSKRTPAKEFENATTASPEAAQAVEAKAQGPEAPAAEPVAAQLGKEVTRYTSRQTAADGSPKSGSGMDAFNAKQFAGALNRAHPELNHVPEERDNGRFDVVGHEKPKVKDQRLVPVSKRTGEPAPESNTNNSENIQKEPWQMSRKEWNDAKINDRAETFGSAGKRNGANETIARIARKEKLDYGITNSDGERVDHKEVIEKAIKEGRAVPDNVLEDYPDLKRTTKKETEIAGASKGAARKTTPMEHPDLDNPEVRADLKRMKDEAGWAQVGGKIIRETADGVSQVTGRTTWIAHHPWFAAMPERLNEHETKLAVNKALAKLPMTAKEKRVVSHMIDMAKGMNAEREEWNKAHPEEKVSEADYSDAIESQSELTDEQLHALADAPTDIESGMRALGFTEKEIADELARETKGAEGAKGTEQVARDDAQGRAEQGNDKARPDDGKEKTGEDSIKIKPGKGIITGKFLSEIDGETVPGGPFDTEEQARNAAYEWGKSKEKENNETKAERSRKDKLAQKLLSGESVTPTDLAHLGIREGSSDLRWFIPRAADLFSISSRQVRPLIKELIRIGHTDMGSKIESVSPIKALSAIASKLATVEKSEHFALSHQRAEEVRAQVVEAEKRLAEQQAEERRAAESERQANIKKEIDQRQESSADNFKLGQSAEEGLSGQDALFSRKSDHGINDDMANRKDVVGKYQGGRSADDNTSGVPTKEQSSKYTEAVASGQKRKALRILHDAIGIKDVDTSVDRNGAHSPSGPEDGSPLYDVTREGTYPEDVYSSNGLRYYGTGADAMDQEAYRLISRSEAHPNMPIKVYRAVYKNESNKIEPGAWVTPIRAYAKEHGDSALKGDYKIISKLVHARDIFTSGDSWLEWGYHPQPFKPELPKGDLKNASLSDRISSWNSRGKSENESIAPNSNGAKFDRGGLFSIGMEKDEVKSEVDRLKASWKNAPGTSIVQSADDLPFKAPADARGAYHNGKVYLVADNIHSVQDAQFVLFHEVLGHAGLRGMFGDDMTKQMIDLELKNKSIRDAAAKWRDDNADIRGNRSDAQWRSDSIEETLADLAGQGKSINGIDKLLAAVQAGLRKIGLDKVADWMENATNAEALTMLSKARQHIEQGNEPTVFGAKEAAAFSTHGQLHNALAEIAKHDEIFRLPKSDKKTVEGIAEDNAPGVEVKKLTNIPGETRYLFKFANGDTARMMVRKANPYGDSIYGFSMKDSDMHVDTEGRPGKNAEHVDGKDDVWIDVSLMKAGESGNGSKMYNIAATYAHNTGKVFIGDPAGLSDEALRRRPEQMLSSALKFGTTEHLGPHPRQIEGDKALGVPGLDWRYGDHEGNIRKLIDVNQKNIENAGGNGDIAYNKKTGQFEDADGNVITRDDINRMAEAGLGRASGSGGATLARHALFRSLLQTDGGQGRGTVGRSSDLLEALREQLRSHDTANVDSPLRKILYSRTSDRIIPASDAQKEKNLSDIRAFADKAKPAGEALDTSLSAMKRISDLAYGKFRESLATIDRETGKIDSSLKTLRNYFNSIDPAARWKSMEEFQKGGADLVTDKNARPFYKAWVKAAADRAKTMQDFDEGFLKDTIPNYFSQMWKDPKAAMEWYQRLLGKGPLEGGKNFMKKRTYASYKEGMSWKVFTKDGDMRFFDTEKEARAAARKGDEVKPPLEPISNNPTDIMQLSLQQMDKFIAMHQFRNYLDENGWVKKVQNGDKAPDGWVRVDDPSFRTRRAFVTTDKDTGKVGAAIIGHDYMVPALIGRDLNNYLSKGLEQHKLWRNFRYAQNLMLSARLGMSAFHAGFTTMDTLVSHVDVGARYLLDGDVGAAVKMWGKAITSPLQAPLEGRKLLKQFYGEQVADPHTAAILDMLTKGGARGKMNPTDFNNSINTFKQAWSDRDFKGTALHALPAMMEGIMAPIANHLVPWQKMTARVLLAKFELDHVAEKLGKQKGDYAGIVKAMGDDAMRQIAYKVVQQVDDRLGQVAYDNMRWNKMAKQVAQASIQSVGWNVGTANVIFGGARDVQRLFKPEQLLAPLDKEGKVTGTLGRVTGRLSYLIALNATVGIMGMGLQYAMTGEDPKDLRDLFFPRTGRKNPDGTDERISLPSYIKDEWALSQHPIQTVQHKLHPSFSMIAELLNNQDFYGNQIANPDDPWTKVAGQVASYLGQSITPYAITGAMQSAKKGTSDAMMAAPFIGITPASASISRTPFESYVFEKYSNAFHTSKTPEDAEKAQARSDAINAIKKGQTPDMSMFTPREQLSIRTSARTSVQTSLFRRLTLQQQLTAYDKASDEEIKEFKLKPIMVRSFAQHGRQMDQDEQQRAREIIASKN
jgi:hypothetical protein